MEAIVQLEADNGQLELFGTGDSYLRLLRQHFGVQITARQDKLTVKGVQKDVKRTVEVIEGMQQKLADNGHLTAEDVKSLIENRNNETAIESKDTIGVFAHHKVVKPSTKGQAKYIKTMLENDLTFCIGPAGSGKTYLAVAIAVSMLKKKQIRRIVLARPAVEAGEKLGFLPGDLQAKVNPYLRPLFDALEDMMDFAMMKKLMNLDIIEIIPLAFMRGRTLNDAAIICDEAQNTSFLQMLMVLTRLGNGSKMIITGDITQIDLEPGQKSGMTEAIKTLRKIKGIGYVELSRTDIVRHKLVQKIVQAYKNQQQKVE